jgi:quercetin 2,3-dioxygenase
MNNIYKLTITIIIVAITLHYTLQNTLQNMSAFTTRTVSKIVKAIEQSEGVGARVRRTIGTRNLRNLSPFLMLDHFSVPYGAGFPDHPHRGQETVTYMLDGAFQHEDFVGHAGRIETGDLQWMTAGKGIMHSEMPVKQPGNKPNVGLQLWVDLPEKFKLTDPRYQELRDADIPRAKPDDKVEIKVISGDSFGVKSPVQTLVGVWYLDVKIAPGGKIEQKLPENWTTFMYTLTGRPSIAGNEVEPFHTVVLSTSGDGIIVENNDTEEARFVIISGEPLDQRVVQHGPFVMTSEEGIYEAMRDFSSNSNGFERAKGWRSEIGKSIY